MTWIMIVFFLAGALPGSFTPMVAFEEKEACEEFAELYDLATVRRVVTRLAPAPHEIHHFEARCLGFETPAPATDA